MKLKDIHANVWIGALLIALSVVFYLMTLQFSNPESAVWPRLILGGIILLSVMLIFNGIKLTKDRVEPGVIPGNLLKGPMASIVMIVLYAIVMNFAGYFVSTAIFLPLGMYALGQRNWKVIVGVTAGLEIFIYILFVTQLQLRMP